MFFVSDPIVFAYAKNTGGRNEKHYLSAHPTMQIKKSLLEVLRKYKLCHTKTYMLWHKKYFGV
ncbi:MAG: hypothetical protein LUH05_00155 [Candidatus Gastranaerophilales bacterium]|nr:hypothetical protein [Candidatus Gastranaerophilales bacterium]